MPSCDGSNCGACACNCNCDSHLETTNRSLRQENSRLLARLQKFETDIENELKKKEAEMKKDIERKYTAEMKAKMRADIEQEVTAEVKADIEKKVRADLKKKLDL